MSTSDPSNCTTTNPRPKFDTGFGWKFGPTVPDSLSTSIEPSTQQGSDWVALPFSDITEITMFRKPLWSVVDRLYHAARLADDCDCKRQAFAVNQTELSQMGLRSEELKWLVEKKIVEQAEFLPDPEQRESNWSSDQQVAADTMIVISDFGVELVEQNLTASALCPTDSPNIRNHLVNTQQELKPMWDNERHELRCAGKIVKKFKWRAANQETILAAFEEEAWPAHIDDPLSQQAGIDPKRRLADAIKSLNRHQKFSLVRFCGDGTGEGVLWEFK